MLIKLSAVLGVDVAALSGNSERALEAGLREVFTEPGLGLAEIPEAEITALAGSAPNASRAVLALAGAAPSSATSKHMAGKVTGETRDSRGQTKGMVTPVGR